MSNSKSFTIGTEPITGRIKASFSSGIGITTVYGDAPAEALMDLLEKLTQKNPEASVEFQDLMYRLSGTWVSMLAAKNGVPLDIPGLGEK